MTQAAAQKKPAPKDWHPADVVAQLRKQDWSLAQLAYANGYKNRSCLAAALHRPYPKAEEIIATALGTKPQVIWPSRYNKDGTTNRRRGPAPLRPAHYTGKATSGTGRRNTQKAGVA